jgi:hypothetical protein
MPEVSVSPPKRLIRNSQWEKNHKKKRKEVKKLSRKVNTQNFRNIKVSSGNKRIEYVPDLD